MTVPAMASGQPAALPPLAAPEPEKERGTTSGWSADLVLLALLLGITALVGRVFSKLGVGDLYITEVFLILIFVTALYRCGFRGALQRLRSTIPLWVLALLWLAGAIATIRGVYLFGLSMVTHDVGLIEYSVMLAIVPVVVDSRERAILLLKVVFWAGLGAGLLYIAQRFIDIESIKNPGYALGIYISIFVLAVACRAANRLPVRWWVFALALVAMTSMSWLGVRAVWLALFAGIVVVAILAPRGRRIAVGVACVAAFVLSNVFSIGLTELQARIDPPPLPPPGAPIAAPDYVPDDGASRFVGGTVVSDDAAQGDLSREIQLGEYLELPGLTGLEIGKPYTVLFAVKPLGREPAVGRVGDTAGTGWGAQAWRAEPQNRWQPVRAVLKPKLTGERVVISFDKGPAAVRVDRVKVIKGNAKGPANDYQDPVPGEEEQLYDDSITKPSILTEAQGTIDPNVAGPANSNSAWRLAIWKFQLERAVQQPFFGVGFGRPTNFRWRAGLGGLYDQREGGPSGNDVTGPHNSFVNIIFRTGLSGLIPLLIILGIAGHRTWFFLRRSDLLPEDRAIVAGVVAIFVFIGVTAGLSVALEGPYMGIFFWSALALLLALPSLMKPTQASPTGAAR